MFILLQDDDDLFSVSKKAEPRKPRKVNKPLGDDDLFGDSGNIFDDIPSKPKEKKKKKAATPKEDIFGESTSKGDVIFPFLNGQSPRPFTRTHVHSLRSDWGFLIFFFFFFFFGGGGVWGGRVSRDRAAIEVTAIKNARANGKLGREKKSRHFFSLTGLTNTWKLVELTCT